jgi:hypothetical protein
MLVAAIAPDGIGLKPLMIVPRLTIERELDFWGYEVTKVIPHTEILFCAE